MKRIVLDIAISLKVCYKSEKSGQNYAKRGKWPSIFDVLIISWLLWKESRNKTISF